MTTRRRLQLRKVPIDDVRPYDRNPRRGAVDAIRESLRANGQYRPLVVRRETGEILSGNHTWEAAKAEGWTHVEIATVSVPDDQAAARIVAADNRIADLGGYDEPELAALLEQIAAPPDDPDDGEEMPLALRLAGTGYDEADLRGLLRRIDKAQAPGEFPNVDGASDETYKCPGCGYEWSGNPR